MDQKFSQIYKKAWKKSRKFIALVTSKTQKCKKSREFNVTPNLL